MTRYQLTELLKVIRKMKTMTFKTFLVAKMIAMEGNFLKRNEQDTLFYLNKYIFAKKNNNIDEWSFFVVH